MLIIVRLLWYMGGGILILVKLGGERGALGCMKCVYYFQINIRVVRIFSSISALTVLRRRFYIIFVMKCDILNTQLVE